MGVADSLREINNNETPHTSQNLLAIHWIEVAIACAIFFVGILGLTLPHYLSRYEQFSRTRIICFACLHTLVAAVLLSTSFVTLIPQILLTTTELSFSVPFSMSLMIIGTLLPFVSERTILFLYRKFYRRFRKTSLLESEAEIYGPFRPGFGSYERKREYEPEESPILGSYQTTYGSAARSINAAEILAEEDFLARCVMCKDNITSMKGVAYHAAGCPPKTLQYFSLTNRSLQGYRGRRQDKREWLPPNIAPFLHLPIAIGYAFLVGFSLGDYTNITSSFILMSLAAVLVIWFVAFSLSMDFKLARTESSTLFFCVPLFALIAPIGVFTQLVVLHYFSWNLASLLLLVSRALVAGLYIYLSIAEIILEEFERHEGHWWKCFTFVTGIVGCIWLANN